MSAVPTAASISKGIWFIRCEIFMNTSSWLQLISFAYAQNVHCFLLKESSLFPSADEVLIQDCNEFNREIIYEYQYHRSWIPFNEEQCS